MKNDSRSRTNPDRWESIEISGTTIRPGETRRIDLSVGRLPVGTDMTMPVIACLGANPGPSLWINAAIHGDELNGVEIVNRVVRGLAPTELRGLLLAVPVVNVYAFAAQTRFLPDRRDLNRSFPGSSRGSLAARIAHIFMTEIVARCSHGIDLHTGSGGRANLPQVRGDLSHDATRRCALAFRPPVLLHAKTRDRSLRQSARSAGRIVLVYEGGEALRFGRDAIEAGIDGVLGVMAELGMLEAPPRLRPDGAPREPQTSRWLRAGRSGLLRLTVGLGDDVEKGETVAWVTDPFEARELRVRSTLSGIVIGITCRAVVHRGDAVCHVAGG